MHRIICFILITCSITRINGQEDFLNPCVDWGKEINQIKLYDEFFNKTLDKLIDQTYLLRFIAKPSFDPEYMFQIEKTENNKYSLQTILFHENLWYTKNRDSIKFEAFKRFISYDLVLYLDSLFKKATNAAMIRKTSFLAGEDGENYYFFRQSIYSDISCGQCWSPSNGTPLDELINICDKLISFAKNDTVNIEEIKDRIDKLYSKIE